MGVLVSSHYRFTSITKPLLAKQQRRLKVKQAYYEYQAKQEHGTQSAISDDSTQRQVAQ